MNHMAVGTTPAQREKPAQKGSGTRPETQTQEAWLSQGPFLLYRDKNCLRKLLVSILGILISGSEGGRLEYRTSPESERGRLLDMKRELEADFWV